MSAEVVEEYLQSTSTESGQGHFKKGLKFYFKPKTCKQKNITQNQTEGEEQEVSVG